MTYEHPRKCLLIKKKTENTVNNFLFLFYFIYLFIFFFILFIYLIYLFFCFFAHFVTVYIKMIIDFKNFSFASTTWSNAQVKHKQITNKACGKVLARLDWASVPTYFCISDWDCSIHTTIKICGINISSMPVKRETYL